MVVGAICKCDILRVRQGLKCLSQSPPRVKNPCLIAQVLSKRTGIDHLIGFTSRFQPTFAMRRGIDSPADFWANAKTFECERFWVNAKTFDYERFWVSPRVRQGLKTPVS